MRTSSAAIAQVANMVRAAVWLCACWGCAGQGWQHVWQQLSLAWVLCGPLCAGHPVPYPVVFSRDPVVWSDSFCCGVPLRRTCQLRLLPASTASQPGRSHGSSRHSPTVQHSSSNGSGDKGTGSSTSMNHSSRMASSRVKTQSMELTRTRNLPAVAAAVKLTVQARCGSGSDGAAGHHRCRRGGRCERGEASSSSSSCRNSSMLCL